MAIVIYFFYPTKFTYRAYTVQVEGKQISNAVNQSFKRLSPCKRIFEEGKSIYEETLKNNGFQC